MKTLSEQQSQELESKIEEFDKSMDSSITTDQENEQNNYENGEYSYLVETSMEIDQITLNDVLQEALEDSTISKKDLIQKVISEKLFKMKYEELANPFHYGGAEEDEFQCISLQGDRSTQVDKENVQEYKPSFNLKEYFNNYEEFKEYVRYNIGNSEHLDHFYNFFADGSSHEQITYSNSYDVVRCVISDEGNEALLEYLKENAKPFVEKTLKLSLSEIRELSESHSGFCINCRKINDGGHEPDAENYDCSHCEKKYSFGIEQCVIRGSIIQVDDDESELDQAVD